MQGGELHNDTLHFLQGIFFDGGGGIVQGLMVAKPSSTPTHRHSVYLPGGGLQRQIRSYSACCTLI